MCKEALKPPAVRVNDIQEMHFSPVTSIETDFHTDDSCNSYFAFPDRWWRKTVLQSCSAVRCGLRWLPADVKQNLNSEKSATVKPRYNETAHNKIMDIRNKSQFPLKVAVKTRVFGTSLQQSKICYYSL